MFRIFLILLLSFISIWPSAFAQSGSKVGVVDGEKLFDEYPGVLESQKKISDAQDSLKDAITESEKIYSEFGKEKKSEAEKLTKKKELQSKIDAKAMETKRLIESVSAKIEDEIMQAIKKVSVEKGLEVVFDKRAVLVGGTDITIEVTDFLKKKMPLAHDNALKEKEAKKPN